jgi:hypothetical protein
MVRIRDFNAGIFIGYSMSSDESLSSNRKLHIIQKA